MKIYMPADGESWLSAYMPNVMYQDLSAEVTTEAEQSRLVKAAIQATIGRGQRS